MPRLTYTKKLMVYGYANDGDVVHYIDNKTKERLLSGRLAERGILVEGHKEPVTLAKFEALAGKYMVKAPCKYIVLPSGKTMEAALNEIKRVTTMEKSKARDVTSGPKGRRGRKPKDAEMPDGLVVGGIASLLTEAENDDFCAYCGNGGDVVELLRCASCPTAMHASCPSVEDILRAYNSQVVDQKKQAAAVNGHEESEQDEDSDEEAATVRKARRKKAEKKQNIIGEQKNMDVNADVNVDVDGAAQPTEEAGAATPAGPVEGEQERHDQLEERDRDHQATPWYCPACSCCVCGKEIDPMGDQYRGAVHVAPDAADGPYMDILEQCNRLHVGDPIPVAVDPEDSEGGSRRKALYASSDVDIEGTWTGATNLQDVQTQDPLPELPSPPPPPVETCVLVSVTGSKAHATCSRQFPNGMSRGVPFDNDGDRAVLEGLAKVCLRGATNIGSYMNDKRVSFQMIHAASATGQPVHGVAPIYTDDQRFSLRKIISAGWSVVKDSYEEIWDSRTGLNLAPMMLQGMCNLPYLDYSGMHIAVLFINSTVVSIACFRVLGHVAEVPIVATRRELRGIKAGSTLLARLDHELHKLGVKALVTQATYKEGPGAYFPYTPSLNPPGAPLPPPGQEVFGFGLARKEYVDAVVARGGFCVPGVSWVERDTGSWADWSTWSSKLAEIHVRLSQTANLRNRLNLLMIKGVRRPKPEAATELQIEMKMEVEADDIGMAEAPTTDAPTLTQTEGRTEIGIPSDHKDDSTEPDEPMAIEDATVVVKPTKENDTVGINSINTMEVDAEPVPAPLPVPIPATEAMQIDHIKATTKAPADSTDQPDKIDTVVTSLVNDIMSRILSS